MVTDFCLVLLRHSPIIKFSVKAINVLSANQHLE